jgi:hypothetical protein
MTGDSPTPAPDQSRDPDASGGPAPAHGRRAARFAKRVGVLGLIFFAVKGLLWIAIPALIARGLL